MTNSQRPEPDESKHSSAPTIRQMFEHVLTMPADVKESELDPVDLAELQLTRAEFERLLELHGDRVANYDLRNAKLDELVKAENKKNNRQMNAIELRDFALKHKKTLDPLDPIKPFRDFLAKRWERISASNPPKDAFAKTIMRMSKADIERIKKENALEKLEIEKKQASDTEQKRKSDEYIARLTEQQKARAAMSPEQKEQLKVNRAVKSAEGHSARIEAAQRSQALAQIRAQEAAQAQRAQEARQQALKVLKIENPEIERQKAMYNRALEAEAIELQNLESKQPKDKPREKKATQLVREKVLEEKKENSPEFNEQVDTIRKLRLKLKWKRAASKPNLGIVGTDLVYSNVPNHPASILCKNVAQAINQVDNSQLKVVNTESKNVNSLLMPQLSLSYKYPSAENSVGLNTLSLDQFILTDNGKEFIPVADTMIRAEAEAESSGKLEYKTYDKSTGKTRLLTQSEGERLLSHSEAVNNFHKSIEASLALRAKKEESRKKINLLKVFANFKKGIYTTMTLGGLVKYLDETLSPEQKSVLDAMKMFRHHSSSEATFKDVMQDYKNNAGLYSDKEVQLDFEHFLARNRFSFQDVKVKGKRISMEVVPPTLENLELEQDPLFLAKPLFLEAIQQPFVGVKTTYGDSSHQLLIDQVYDTANFPAVIEAMQTKTKGLDIKKLTDYLQGMPVTKISAFVNALCKDNDTKKLTSFFIACESNFLLSRMWRFISNEQKGILDQFLPTHKLEEILKPHYDKAIFNEIAGEMRDAKQIVEYLRGMELRQNVPLFINTFSNEKLSEIFNNNLDTRDENNISHLAILWSVLNENQKMALVERIDHPEKLETILNSQTNTSKIADFEIAKKNLLATIARDGTNNTDEAKYCLAMINQVRDVTPISKLHSLTEFTHRSALYLTNPANENNKTRCIKSSKKVVGSSRTNILLGALVVLAGVGLIFAAGMLAASTAGASTPLSVAAAVLGAELAAAGVAGMTVGAAAIAFKGSSIIAKGVVMRKFSNAAGSLFKPKKEAAVKNSGLEEKKQSMEEVVAAPLDVVPAKLFDEVKQTAPIPIPVPVSKVKEVKVPEISRSFVDLNPDDVTPSVQPERKKSVQEDDALPPSLGRTGTSFAGRLSDWLGSSTTKDPKEESLLGGGSRSRRSSRRFSSSR